jgi:D-alanine-D-alanine ligase
MRIGLAYNQRPSTTGSINRDLAHPQNSPSAVEAPDAFVEWDEPETIDAVARALSALGEVVLLEAVDDFAERLAAARVDLLFNIAEGFAGPSREAHVPAIAEFLRVPYTASDPLTLTLALHKGRTKEILAHRGIPTAPFVLIETPADVARLSDPDVTYPRFLKPAWEGSSKGIAEANFAVDADAAVTRAAFLLETYAQPVVAEAYLPGEEFTVAVLGNGEEARALPVIRYRFETLPDGALPIMGYEAKWVWDRRDEPLDVLECPAEIPPVLARRIQETALAAARALGCRDWARVDLRLDRGGVPNVVEINPLPGIIPNPADNSCFPRAASAAGIAYDELIRGVARIAWRRITGRDLPERVRAQASA